MTAIDLMCTGDVIPQRIWSSGSPQQTWNGVANETLAIVQSIYPAAP
jgi:hypothetical protein